MTFDEIIPVCLGTNSKNPVAIFRKLTSLPFCHINGPEHHILVGSALLTAYKNAGGDIDLKPALIEMIKRGGNVPGMACGLWGACGAGISSGIFISIITDSGPLTQKPMGLSNLMTSSSLATVLQAGFFPLYPLSHRLCEGALRNRDGEGRDKV